MNPEEQQIIEDLQKRSGDLLEKEGQAIRQNDIQLIESLEIEVQNLLQEAQAWYDQSTPSKFKSACMHVINYMKGLAERLDYRKTEVYAPGILSELESEYKQVTAKYNESMENDGAFDEMNQIQNDLQTIYDKANALEELVLLLPIKRQCQQIKQRCENLIIAINLRTDRMQSSWSRRKKSRIGSVIHSLHDRLTALESQL